MSDPTTTAVSVAHGDGIGPEIMSATLAVLEAAGARLDLEPVALGRSVYEGGVPSGIAPDAWASIRRTRVLLKAPLTTPQGGSYKSVNVTLRKALGLYANVRPAKSYAPFVPSLHPDMNLVVIRENEEDLYAGIEHQQTREVHQVLKLITRPGSEKIVRYAFAYARAYGRRKVTCMTKDNIMKRTDGLFHQVFDEVASEYPEIEAEHMIIDIGAARLAAQPEAFDVIVTLNLYGDILSDITAQLAGSVGLAGSANIGERVAMFEAVHGSAPDIAGRDLANPSGLLIAATQMLIHLGQTDAAERIKNAWLATLEDGVHTADIHRAGTSARRVGTEAFARAVIERFGEEPSTLAPVRYRPGTFEVTPRARPPAAKALVGVDVFVDWSEPGRDPDRLGALLSRLAAPLTLQMITNRGIKVWPDGLPETFRTDHWRCRFVPPEGEIDHAAVVALLSRLESAGIDFIKTEHLVAFDGEPGFSLGHGQ